MEREQSVGRAARPAVGEIAMHGVVLTVSSVISYWSITHLLANVYSVSRDDDLLGGMWAVVATIFVYRFSREESVHSALSRMAATLVSFVLCLAYLALFPFHVWGMAALIGIGTVAVALMGRPEDTITTGITIAVIMVVAELSPHHAWRQPILRLADTAVGVAVGLSAWICTAPIFSAKTGASRNA